MKNRNLSFPTALGKNVSVRSERRNVSQEQNSRPLFKLFLTGIVCFSFFGVYAAGSKTGAYDLRCEYQANPVGIDAKTPRFSWKLSDADYTRRQKQTAYHLLVASSPSLLDDGRADVWNSGKVISSQSLLIPFAGKELESGRKYYWKVQLFDKDGLATEWSAPAQFTTGLYEPSDWTGAWWIQYPDAPVGKHVWFRKKLRLDAPAQSALIHVASIGYHELYVNGKKADDRILAPALTRLSKRVLYVTYDIAPLLRAGENVIAFWQASGWANFEFFNLPACIKVKLNGVTADNKKFGLSSDRDWRCAVSNSEDNNGMRYSNNGGELYDARYYLPGWNRIDFDDSKWSGARNVDMRTELCAHAVEPTRIIDTILPVGIAGSNPYKIDMGRNYTGWVQLNMSGLSAGDTIYIKVADDAETEQDCGQLNRYISNGAEKESFCNRFNYIAGRYITIEGLKRKPELSDITGYAIGTDLKQTGSFSCSNELFNRIYATDLWTFRVNTTEGYTSDCPHRERMGYGEETFATAWGIGLPNYESGAYYNKVVRDWTDVQEANGWFHHTAPQVNKHFGGVMWSSAGLNVSWEHYLQFGDRKILETIYPAAVRWLDFLHRNTKADGLLACYGEHWGFFLGDWAAPGQRSEGGDSPQAIYFNNCTYAMNLETVIEIAKVLGHSDAASLYAGRLEALKAHIHKAFFKPDSCIYSDGNQVQLAFALITGITPEDKIQAVRANLANALAKPNAYFDMGSSGLPVLLRYLTQHPGTGKLAAAILAKTTEPGYGYFLRRGETTWPEYWNIDVQSRMHTCYTGIAGWLTKSLCGIHPDSQSPGFRRFVIQPVIVPEVSFAEAAVESPYGRIESRWERQGGRTELSVTVPPNSVATVYIPARSADRITESGVNIGKSEEITLQGTAGGYVMVEVGAGKYKFQSK